MKARKGFTVIELIVVIALLATGSWLFFSEKIATEATQRDNQRKTAINAMYYSLEEVYFEKNNYYPNTIDSKTLRSVDPSLFTDPNGHKLGSAQSSYHYSGTDCTTDNQCKGYKLTANLEREADYTKTNRNNT
jgi:hypothetical protein